MKRFALIALLMAMFILFSTNMVVASDPSEFFSDADGWHDEFFADSAYWLGRTGIFIGDGQSRLLPQNPLTRAEMAVVLTRMTGQVPLAMSLTNSSTTWTDDAAIPQWARGYLVLAQAREWFIGHPDGTVGPNDNLTFAQIAILLARVTDNEDLAVGPWPTSALVAAEAMELFSAFAPVSPDHHILRGEMVSATLRAMVAETFKTRAPADGGPGLPLMAQNYADDYEAWASEEPETVTGPWTHYLPASQRITVGDDNYPVQMEGDDVAVEVVINRHTVSFVDFNVVFATYQDETVTLSLNDQGEVVKIEAVIDTYPDVILTDVATASGEDDFGTITVTGSGYTLEVDDETDILLDGQPASLADLEEAFSAFCSDWNTDHVIVTVRTYGALMGNGQLAIWISVITDNILEGEVTGKGTDVDGSFIRVDGVKYHYLAPLSSIDFATGETYALLLDSQDRVRSILETEIVESAEFFGMLVDFEVDVENEGIATFRFSDGVEREYPFDATAWSLIPANLDWVWYVEHDGVDLVTFIAPTSVTQVVTNEELVTVTDTYLQTFDGGSTTTLPLAPSRFAWDETLLSHVEIGELIGQQIDVYVDSNGQIGFVMTHPII